MAKYNSGQKIVQERIGALQREIDALKSATPVLYGVEQGRTYGKALAALREAYARGEAGLQPQFVKDDGSSVIRPLTFEETIDSIVNAYESGNTELLAHWNDTCTGIAYKAGTTEFKIIPVSQELILLHQDFSQLFVTADYGSQQGTELDKNKGKYNVPLTKTEVLEHDGWLEAVRDKSLLKAFRDIVFAERKTNVAMGFYVRGNPQQDQLRALAVYYLDSSSGAYGRLNLVDDARFVRVSPK